MKRIVTAAVAVTATLLFAAPALADCRIHNDTDWDFIVESGITSNQSVDAHSETSIDAGKIKGIDKKDGKTISGTCKDGDHLEITNEDGVPVLSVK